MNLFQMIFRRKPKELPRVEPEIVDGVKPVRFRSKLEDMEQISVERNKPGDDLIGREFGNHNEARNRVHVFRQPFGYPIRLCDWVAVDREKLFIFCHAEGPNGPAEMEMLKRALEYESMNLQKKGGRPICKSCQAVVDGKRKPLMGGPAEGVD